MTKNVLKIAIPFLVGVLFIFNITTINIFFEYFNPWFARIKLSQIYPTTATNNSHDLTIFKPPPRQYLCYRFLEQMGNHMFIFASIYGIAKEKNMIVLFNTRQLRQFKMRTKNNVIQYGDDLKLCKNATEYSSKFACKYTPEDKVLGNESVVRLIGYLQSWKYFKNAEKEIRELYTFQSHIIKKAQSYLQEIKEQHFKNKTPPKTVTFVGIHVRRGDMINSTKGYMVASKSYFLKAIAAFRKKFQYIIFVLTSDSLKWSKENLPSTIHMRKGSAVMDMAILTLCNHTISSVGTFSWWSAWLANGITTYYMPPARAGSRLRRAFSEDFSDFFWPGWIPIRDEDKMDDIHI